MNARILPREEWSKLAVTGLHSLLPDFREEDCKPIVIEENGEIVGTITVLRTVHLESIWIRPGSRAGVTRSLIREAIKEARKWGRIALAQSCRENVISILRRMKTRRLDVETYILPLEN